MGRYWLNFAMSGDPNGPDLPDWSATGAADDALVNFEDEVSTLTHQRNPQIDLMEKIIARAMR
jgi:carboxylesterase type B